MPTYYELLGVSPDSSQEEIKKAYRELALAYHPDVNNSSKAQDLMRLLNEAYEVLSDPQKRAEYDARIRVKRPYTENIRADTGEARHDNSPADDDNAVDYSVYEEEVRKHARDDAGRHDEAAADERPYVNAGPNERMFSALLDIVIGLLAFPAAYVIASSIVESWHAIKADPGSFDLLLALSLFLIALAYCAIFEGSGLGATPGKIYFKILVRDQKGERISAYSAIVRSIFKVSPVFILIYTLTSGYALVSLCIFVGIVLLLYLKNWTLQDYMAKTIVVKKQGISW